MEDKQKDGRIVRTKRAQDGEGRGSALANTPTDGPASRQGHTPARRAVRVVSYLTSHHLLQLRPLSGKIYAHRTNANQ